MVERLKFLGQDKFVEEAAIDNFILNNPYKEFEVTLAAGAIENIFYNFSFLQILEASSTSGLELRFGGAAAYTDVVSAGVGFKLPLGRVTDRVQLTNTSGASITIKVALAIGDINDSRFTASGVITVKDVASTFEQETSSITVNGTASTIITANTNRRELVICNLSSSTTVFLGNGSIAVNRGVALLPQQSIVLSTTASISGITSGAGVSLSVCEMEY